ncbi:hypothetical protein HPB49_000393 [Dermacentor silvarum]|uniref:Uncharacterized protein n=1 Tax=Dermacentor silvarum TaxID=543639 RepID=A0ACB8DSJ2_DERSI|nr:hypothetical protein HPB49_000393 [Dermacentor silvarum]
MPGPLSAAATARAPAFAAVDGAAPATRGPLASCLWEQAAGGAFMPANELATCRASAKGYRVVVVMYAAGADGEQTVNFIYTNYKNCIVVDFPFNMRQSCGLWVTKDALISLPQECFDQFEDNCDTAVAVFDEETCNGVLENI